MSSTSYSPLDSHAESSSHATKPSSGLTFVLPPLSALKAQKTKKKIKLTYEEPPKRQPRPVKLKPLKEVLTRLITQIKRKDDYAFFLKPVDLVAVPHYTDIIARPMDLGTMTTKVERGKYRSLEEFASDLRLVTTNAKTFNAPGSIFYTEAERIEKYALDHISKAASTVIEYETDWNIDVERDDDATPVDVDDVADGAMIPKTPMNVDESRAESPSVTAAQVNGKKGKGKKVPTLTETLEPDGGLPGAKDGLGSFPPGSDWAELMLALKLKGKRYRTKKERMRMEKGGPPIAADGSLDYPEMEDPFSILSAVVPDPMSRPYLPALYPSNDPSNSSQPPFPTPVHIIPSSEPPPVVIPSTSSSSQLRSKSVKPVKRRHWVINRNAPRRVKEVPEEESTPAWKEPREPVATDFGSFSVLPSLLAEERKINDIGAALGSQNKFFGALRDSLQPSISTTSSDADALDDVEMEDGDEAAYWKGKGKEAEAYICDVVYGGVDGYAYVRSLAEFLTPSEPINRNGEPPTYDDLGMPVARWVEENVVNPLTAGRHRILHDAAKMLNNLPLTPPLSPRSTPPPSTSAPPTSPDPTTTHIKAEPSLLTSVPAAPPFDVARQIDLSLHTHPATARALAHFRAVLAGKIDLPSLIRAPDELFCAEDVWAGRAYREKRRKEMDDAFARDPGQNAAAYLQWAIAEHREAEASAGGAEAPAGARGAAGAGADEAGMLAYALEVATQEIERLVREGHVRPAADGPAQTEPPSGDAAASTAPASDGQQVGADADGDVVMKTGAEEAATADGIKAQAPAAAVEDAVLKQLRLNLLALAKRAPLDQIMKLPPELVPAHLRHIVPTADA
ncbi:uncharacterized protein BXZ73DRAFT_43030 [Epithele typhae]|uniref:uncharacterized protein n=1 Tax=Epithele typhae TaxID=378194 RepID=UPI0020079485|nr:uncharacterized protein BXZ73DRAFT_43030 [Epithele typhae]KAH9940042.1 hypothetical protein BXZ73DRAFT_43030 [Epithele typhae]